MRLHVHVGFSQAATQQDGIGPRTGSVTHMCSCPILAPSLLNFCAVAAGAANLSGCPCEHSLASIELQVLMPVHCEEKKSALRCPAEGQ